MAVEEEPKSLEEEEEKLVLKPEGLAKKNGIFICLKWAFAVFLLMVAFSVSISLTDCPLFNGYGVEDVQFAGLSSYWEPTLNGHQFGQFSIPLSLSTDELSPMFSTNSTCLIGGSDWEEEEQDQEELDDEEEPEDSVKEEPFEEALEEDVGSAEEDENLASGGFVQSEEDSVLEAVEEDDVLSELDSPISAEVHTDFADTMEISVLEVLQPEEEQQEQEVHSHLDDSRRIPALEEPDVGIDEKDGSFQMHHEEEGRMNGFSKSSPLLIISAVAVAAAVAIFAKRSARKEERQHERAVVKAATDSSGPSSGEVSTSGNSRRRGRRRAGEGEEEEGERRKGSSSSRRESVATSDHSSWGSPSYGSFTTYERIPLKHHHLGNGGGDEGMTPVRRSSRIRSQAISSPS